MATKYKIVLDTQAMTITNKTVALGSNTVSGTLAEFNTACTNADFSTGGGTATGTNTGDDATNTTSNTYADDKVADAINDGTTTIAPSQNAVFDALALKASIASPTFTGTVILPTGTTSAPPMILVTGVNTTNKILGAIEFDGTNIFISL